VTAFLQVAGLTAGYQSVPVLHDVSLAVDRGRIAAVIGPNGAGKTTLARAITGLAKTFDGDVVVGGVAVTRWSVERRARYGIVQVPEGRRLFARMSVIDNLDLAFFWRRGKLPARERRAMLDRIFELFPVLAQRRQQVAGTLSGGEQQMLAIGRALLLQPQVLVLDEPCTGLSPLMAQRILTALSTLVSESRCACLLIEQRALAALQVAGYAYLLDRGRLVMAAEAAKIMDSDSLRESYLGGI